MRPAVADLPGGADTSAAGLSRIFTIVGESRASLARCSLASGSPGAIWRIQGFPSGVLNLSIPSSSSRRRDFRSDRRRVESQSGAVQFGFWFSWGDLAYTGFSVGSLEPLYPF